MLHKINHKLMIPKGVALINFFVKNGCVMRKIFTLVLFCLAAIPSYAISQELTDPKGKVILTIYGKLDKTNHEESARFDIDMLMSINQSIIETETPWTNGLNKFEGPAIKEILALVGAKGEEIIATALNGYKITIPFSDTDEFPVILALQQNDEILSVRKKGPTWVIYPWTENPDLKNNVYYTRAIWQVKSLEVR
jgi:hypothetical protein